MSYLNRLNLSLKLKIILTALCAIAGTILVSGTASALAPVPSNTLPESSDFSQGNHVWVTTANADGSNFLLDAQTSVIRVYSNSQSVTLHINNGGMCLGSGVDQGDPEGNTVVRYEFHSLSYQYYTSTTPWQSAPYRDDGANSAAATTYSYRLGCGQANVTLTGGTPVPTGSGVDEYAQNGRYAFEVRAIWQNAGAYGWNQVKYSVDLGAGRLGYYAGSGDHFALKADNNTGNTSCTGSYSFPGCPGTFQLGFAPNCQLTSATGPKPVTVNWFDMDAGQPNQNGKSPIKSAIFEYSESGAQSIPNFTGVSGGSYDQNTGIVSITSQNGQRGSVSFMMKPHYKYMWIVYQIYTANGIQFQLPTDSYNTLINYSNCGSTTGAANAKCVATAVDPLPQVGDPATVNVKLTNTSTGTNPPTFNNTYEVRQVTPGGMVIAVSPNLSPGNSETLGTFNINARTTAQTVTFHYQLFDGAGKQVGSECTTDITWTAGAVSCIAVPDSTTHKLGESASIVVTLKNNSGSALPGTDEMRQVTPGGQAKQLGSSLANGSSRVLPAYTINARSTTQTVTFYYALFSGSSAGSPAVGNNPLCNTQITWNGTGTSPPPASFTVACGYTHVYNLTSTATSSTTTSGGTYQTYQQPDNYPSTPYVWATPPPPAGSPFLPGVPTYSYTPTTTTSSTATTIPLHFHFAGSDGSSNDAYFDKSRGNAIGNPIADQPFDTFNQFGFLWPHVSYTVTLEAQTSGDVGAGENGPYTYNQQLGSQNLNGNCLDASCGTPSSVDAEPGQTKTLSYGVYIYNHTNKTFSANDGNGYNFSVGSNGGVVNVSGVNASPDLSPGDPSTTNVSFSARIDFTGGFWVTMNFKGGAISLPSLSVPCPAGSITPATRAFFEVRGSDISTGGGFSDANSVCATTAPGYVSPATGYSSTSGRYDYAGGVRAYANPNAGRGSQAQYGLLSLGLTIGSPNGPIGFFSGHNEVFANTGVPNAPNGGNLGGYLSPSGPTSAHCVDDFFTKTRLTDSTPAAFSGNSITGLASGQYQANGPITLTSAGCGSPSVGVGKQITLYVDGDVTINNNICYAKQWDPTNRANVPYFALIVHGNITLTSGVSQLDGLYVAQPSSSFNGIFNTCSDFCPNQLIVNGAVIAQQVSLNRAHGTLGPLDADVNNISSQPAEIFNYVPSMIIGTPNFNPLYNSLEALFSLPPVF